MSESLERLRHQLDGAAKLGNVVRTMKTMAAANIGHYEEAVASLARYRETLDRGLAACLRAAPTPPGLLTAPASDAPRAPGLVAFGSDQGLVGDFNEALAAQVARDAGVRDGDTHATRVPLLWVVGERLAHALEDQGYVIARCHPCPWGIEAVGALVGELLLDIEAARSTGQVASVHLYANHPGGASGRRPVSERLLPLDRAWREARLRTHWPGHCLPEALGGTGATLPALLRQHLFLSLFAACANSLAAENLSRLLAMQRAERNIDELVDELGRRYHRERQAAIDDELFDLVAGFEALQGRTPRPPP
ncbi:MAG: F0F1 ATP synthase subunit gamma [Gammaproteobacteria bacterium]